jgi:fido (protein-threonine AMPylation protein)
MSDIEENPRDFVSEFDDYVRQGEPHMKEKVFAWQTAIGLQAVDNLTPSEYLFQTAKENIEGRITIKEAKDRLDEYHKARSDTAAAYDRTEEADKVSARIAEILSEKAFTFSPAELIAIHKRLFTGIYEFAGIIRNYNISKAEWALRGKTVYYATADSIREALDYDFEKEKAFDYRGLSEKQTVEHIARFISDIWQVHAFGEGNTRTTAVFAIKYLQSFGFFITNNMFAEHSWYFRNALVRANYSDLKNNIHATREYLDRFFANLLLGGRSDLLDGDLLIKNSSDLIFVTSPKDVTLNDTLKFIIDNPKATQAEIAEGIGKSVATVKRATAELSSSGMLKRMNGKRDGYWRVK